MVLFKNIIHIVCVLFLSTGWILFFLSKKPRLWQMIKNNCEAFKRSWQNIVWIVVYLVLLALSTSFVWENWNKCLDMEFFTHFNGYNIIWMLWIFLLFVPLISIDNKWFKMVNPLTKKELERQKAEESAKTEQYATQFESLELENEKKKRG